MSGTAACRRNTRCDEPKRECLAGADRLGPKGSERSAGGHASGWRRGQSAQNAGRRRARAKPEEDAARGEGRAARADGGAGAPRPGAARADGGARAPKPGAAGAEDGRPADAAARDRRARHRIPAESAAAGAASAALHRRRGRPAAKRSTRSGAAPSAELSDGAAGSALRRVHAGPGALARGLMWVRGDTRPPSRAARWPTRPGRAGAGSRCGAVPPGRRVRRSFADRLRGGPQRARLAGGVGAGEMVTPEALVPPVPQAGSPSAWPGRA